MKTLRMLVNPLDGKGIINKNLYGHFLEHTGRIVMDGLVSEQAEAPTRFGVRRDILDAYRELEVPLLHWPGGFTTEFYHWRDGIGPKDARGNTPDRLTGRVERNQFGTHEFLDLCEFLHCDPYLVFGTGAMSVRELCDWMEYMTFDGDSDLARLRRENGRDRHWTLPYVCYGNEWWFYEEAETFAARVRTLRHFINTGRANPPRQVIRGPHFDDLDKSSRLVNAMRPDRSGLNFDAMALYVVMRMPQGQGANEDSEVFTTDDYLTMLTNIPRVAGYLARQAGIARAVPANARVKLALDEWGSWYKTREGTLWEMEVTMRDAILAASFLNLLNENCDLIEMASICMSVNALCAPLKTRGAQLLKTPVFHVLRMYKAHQNARHVFSFVERETMRVGEYDVPCVSHSASIRDGKLCLTLVNCAPGEEYELDALLPYGAYTRCAAEILCAAPQAHNSFESPDAVQSQPYDGVSLADGKLRILLPPVSVLTVTLEA